MPLSAAKWNKEYSADDLKAIRAALDRQWGSMQGADAKRWFGTVDPDHVYRVLSEGRIESLLIGGYLLAVAVDKPWWSPEKTILHEQMLLKVDPGACSIRPVIRALIRLGSVVGAAGIACGTSLNSNDRKLARVYERFGFRTIAHSLYMEL